MSDNFEDNEKPRKSISVFQYRDLRIRENKLIILKLSSCFFNVYFKLTSVTASIVSFKSKEISGGTIVIVAKVSFKFWFTRIFWLLVSYVIPFAIIFESPNFLDSEDIIDFEKKLPLS